jgi:hypothetical protein
VGISLRRVSLDDVDELTSPASSSRTFQSNAGARRFYEREGFVAVEETDGRGNEEGAPDLRCVWPGRAVLSPAPPPPGSLSGERTRRAGAAGPGETGG